MSCDRMSHDHLQCDHRMMHHRDTNRMDATNLDVSWRQCHRVDLTIDPECYDPTHWHRVNRRVMDDHLMVCRKMI